MSKHQRYNHVTLIGRLVDNPEVSVITNKNDDERTVTSARLAVSRFGKSEVVDFFPVDFWGKLGENANKYLSKGRLVLITGEIHLSEKQTDVDGIKITQRYTNVSADNFQILENKEKSNVKAS